MPFSSAIFFAKGETNILEPSEVELETEVEVVSCFFSFGSSFDFSTVASFFGVSSVFDVLPPTLKFLATPETSVPSGPIIANKASTFADSPSFKPTCSNVPDWNDSNSIVALSVSISARISPSSTLSPTFFNQVATVPSSMVSLNRGIVTTTTPSGRLAEADSSGVSFSSVFSSLSSDVDSLESSSFLSSLAGFFSSFEAPPPFTNSEISSPSSPMIAKSSSTLAVSPSLIPMCNKVPS